MEKHEQMVQHNRSRSEEKVSYAIKVIRQMVNDDEQVLVCKLVKSTGLSRGFFYNNEAVHRELVRAQELQEGKSFAAPQKGILDKAMDKEILFLKKKLEEKDKEITKLKSENAKLQKTANSQTIKLLSSI